MRFLREGAGPGGLPGGERKCMGFVAGWGALRRGWGGGVGGVGPRLQAGLLMHTPSHLTLSGVGW